MLPSELVALETGQRVRWPARQSTAGWVLANTDQALVIGWDDGTLTTLPYVGNAEKVIAFAEMLQTAGSTQVIINGPAE